VRTWHVELVFVALVLALVVLLTGDGPADWLTAAAVLLTFAHAQVADRLAEEQAARPVAAVECHAWAGRYWTAKEALWALSFIFAGLWPALVGAGVFLVYPVWRGAYRRWKPLRRYS
jgi:hypothetical protein